jgi:hypothetical protein
MGDVLEACLRPYNGQKPVICMDEQPVQLLEKLNKELAAWQQERNLNQKTVKRRFTTKDARIKLHDLHPSI